MDRIELEPALTYKHGNGCFSFHLLNSIGNKSASKYGPHNKTLFSTCAHQQEQGKWERSTWLKPLRFIPGAIAFWLGTWQLMLAKEKATMLERRQSRIEMEPLKGNRTLLSNNNLDSLEFRRIVCKGVYDEKKSIYVRRRYWKKYRFIEDGYNLITPLIPIPGDPESVQSPILVNRGWVPENLNDKALNNSENERSNNSSTNTQQDAKVSRWSFWFKKLRAIKPTDTRLAVIPVQVTGVARRNEKPNKFVPANDPTSTSSKWFIIDIPALARACGLPEETICVEDLTANEANPKNSRAVTPDDHINLSAAMYTKSAIAIFIAIKSLKPRKGSM